MKDATKISLCVVVILQQQMSKELELTSALLALKATPAFADQVYSSCKEVEEWERDKTKDSTKGNGGGCQCHQIHKSGECRND
tara:strand:+ start:416 stop:664 length:249 start_codon:yes stop_codon:yes gene_type:complete